MRNVFAGALAALSILTSGQASAKEILYIHNTYSGVVSKISIPEHEVLGEIEIGYYMDYLAASPDGKILYVNRIDGDLPGARARNVGVSGELIAVSTRTDEILWRVTLDGMPHHMSVSPDGRRVFVPYYDTWWVVVVDTETKEIVKKIWVGHGSHGTKLNADGTRLYVGSMMNDTMTIIDTETLKVVDVIGFRAAVRPFDFHDDESVMYVQQSWLHGFVRVDMESKEQRTVMLPTFGKDIPPPSFYPHNVNHGILLSHDEKKLWVNGSALDFVAVYNVNDLELEATISVGSDPNSITFSIDGRYAYISNRKSDDLSVIDTALMKEVKRIKLKKYPQRMVVIDVPD